MSVPHYVPKGWTRGKELRVMDDGPRYALMELWTTADFDPAKVASADDIAAITFDSKDEALAWAKWWYSSDSGSEQ
jgi:hypothetical protein